MSEANEYPYQSSFTINNNLTCKNWEAQPKQTEVPKTIHDFSGSAFLCQGKRSSDQSNTWGL